LRPILWLTRTLKNAVHIAKIGQLFSLRTVVAAGRNQTCLKIFKDGLDPDLASMYCRLNRFKCLYFQNLFKTKLPSLSLMHFQMLTKIAQEEMFCPYYAQDIIDCDIVVQNYNRRRGRPFRVVVVDEAHNLWLPKEVRVHNDKLNDIIAFIDERELRNKLETLKRRAEYSKVINIEYIINENDIEELRYYLYTFIEERRPIARALVRLLRILKADVIYSDGQYLVGLQGFKRIKADVYLSGTWFNEMKQYLNDLKIVEVPPVRRPAYVLDWVTSKYGEETIDEYGRLLFTLRKYFRKIVVFGADRILRYFKNRCDYYEPEKVEGLEGLILLRARGRFSEGVDIPCDCIVMLGCPFMPPEIIGRLESIYRKAGFSNPWMLAAEIPMLITTLQCIGRATRTPDAKPLILLADDRYHRYRDALSRYLDIEEIEDDCRLEKVIRNVV